MLSSNAIQNVAHAISRSKDEYMLSECAKSVWFTIELCETINILRYVINHDTIFGLDEICGYKVSILIRPQFTLNIVRYKVK